MRKWGVVCAAVAAWSMFGAFGDARASEDTVTLTAPYERSGAAASGSTCGGAPSPFGPDCTWSSSSFDQAAAGELVSSLDLDTGGRGTAPRHTVLGDQDTVASTYLLAVTHHDEPVDSITVRIPVDVATVVVDHGASIATSAADVTLHARGWHAGCGAEGCFASDASTVADGATGTHVLELTLQSASGAPLPAGDLEVIVEVDAHVALGTEGTSATTPEVGPVANPVELPCLGGRPPFCPLRELGVYPQQVRAGVAQGFATASVTALVPAIEVTYS